MGAHLQMCVEIPLCLVFCASVSSVYDKSQVEGLKPEQVTSE